MFEISCHTSGFIGLTLEQAIRTAARLGFRLIDLDTRLIDLDRAMAQPKTEAAGVSSLLKDFNLRLGDFYLPLPDLSSPEPTNRDAALQCFERLLPFLLLLQPPGVTLSAGALQSDGREHSVARAMIGLLAIQRSLELNAPSLRLAFEPAAGTALENITDALLVLDCVPGLRLTLDLGHLQYLGMGRTAIARLLSGAIHLQLRQAARNRSQMATELGTLNIEHLVEDLHQIGYRGVVSVKYLKADPSIGALAVNVIEETVKTRDVLRDARRAYYA